MFQAVSLENENTSLYNCSFFRVGVGICGETRIEGVKHHERVAIVTRGHCPRQMLAGVDPFFTWSPRLVLRFLRRNPVLITSNGQEKTDDKFGTSIFGDDEGPHKISEVPPRFSGALLSAHPSLTDVVPTCNSRG